jgi:DNA-binding ferritin-like protein
VTDLHDPLAALNAVISEVIDFIQEVKQARWKASAPGALHTELDRLWEDVRGWARLLVERDEQLGQAPLASMPTATARTPRNLWPGTATADDVRDVLDQQLDRLGRHVEAALSEQQDEQLRSALDDVERGVVAHRHALTAL